MEAYSSMVSEAEQFNEGKQPSKAEIHKVLGPTKNSDEGIKALMKAFRCDKEQAQKYLDSVMEEVEEACSRMTKKEELSSKEKMARGMYNKEEMDPVDKKELKGKHADRKDKDIDNDGDVDSSDKYLHKRRKAVSKAVKNDGESEVSKIKVSTEDLDLEDILGKMWSEIAEARDAKHTKGATKAEPQDDKMSPKSKDFVDAHKKSDKDHEGHEEDGHTKTFKATRSVSKQAASRGNDNLKNGDTKVVNPVGK